MKLKSQTLQKAALMLVLCTIGGVCASCANDKAQNPTETKPDQEKITAAESEDIPLDGLEARKLVSDDVPELDFGGRDFRMFYQKRFTTDAVPETNEETGDIINDAVYRRNRTIEERFNIHIVGIEGEENPMVQTLMNAVTAGDDAYDLFLGHSVYASKAALAGYFYNWYDIPYMDFTKPWYPQASIDALKINDRMYLTVSDLCLSFASMTYCMYFNKQLSADNDLPDIYGIVKDGNWTIDTLHNLSKDLYKDLNGSGTSDIDDQFGFAGETGGTHATTWLFSCDVPTVELHDDGTVKSVFVSERAATMIDKLRPLYNDNQGSYWTASNRDQGTCIDSFINGRSVFLTNVIMASTTNFRDVMFDYGIIPYPKLDDAQSRYLTIPGGSVSSMAIPLSTVDIDFCGAVTTALCRESWVSVMPDYYDVVLKVKGTRDETSIEMLDLIFDGRSVTTAFLYDSFVGYYYEMANLLTSNKELASYAASIEKRVLKHYESVIELFCGDEG